MREANKLIEDFMLLANVRVALALARPAADRMHVPGAATRTAVYRIHDRPDAEKLQALRVFVARFGLEMEKPTAANAEQALRNLLQAAAGSASESVIKTMAIRSMAKAEYSTRNIGHYGLAFPFYTHFTSPIRRYPDVMVHRLLQDLLDGRPSAEPGPLERNAAHSSIMEKRASEAERASIRYKQVEYLSTRLGETFHGVVSGAVPKGLFIEVEENKCEGFVPKDALPMDHWVFNDELLAFTGLQSGAVVGMGDRLVVRVVAADLARRQLEFDLPDGVPGRSADAGVGKGRPTGRKGKVSLPSRSPRP
jgi:ribonuclease R